jgi:hypothetical protein
MFNFFKKKKEVDLDEYGKDPVLKKQWIEHFYIVSFEKPEEGTHKDFLTFLENQNDSVLQRIVVSAIGISELGKSISVKSFNSNALPSNYSRVLQFYQSTENTYFMIIRFPNLEEKDLKKGVHFGYVEGKRNYDFSPIQSLQSQELCKSVELAIHFVTKAVPHKILTLVTGKGKEVIIHEFDGLQFLTYPLSKRAELFSKYPELDEKIFSMNFEKFAKWIIEKERDSESMKRNADRTRQILKKFKIKI